MQVFDFRMIRHRLQHRVLEMGHIGKIERAIKTNAHHLGGNNQVGMIFDIPETAVLMAAQNGHPGRHGAVEDVADGQKRANNNAFIQMGRCQQGDNKGGHRDKTIGPARLPDMQKGLGGDQAGHGKGDNHRQHRLGQMIDIGGEEHQGNGDEKAIKHHGKTGLCPGLQVDGRTGEGAAGWIGLKKGTAYVGQALADQFLVGVNALFGGGGHGLGHGDGFHEGDQRHHQGRAQQLHNAVYADGGNLKGRQTGRHPAHHLAATAELKFTLTDFLDIPQPAVGLDTRRHGMQLVKLAFLLS